MKNINSLRLTISAFAVLVSASSFGQNYTQCRTIDFSELQSYNKEELVKNYCKNSDASKAAYDKIFVIQDTQKKYIGIANDYIKIGAVREAQKTLAESKAFDNEINTFHQNISTCSGENERVTRALASKNTRVESCEPLTLANINEPPPPPPALPQDPLVSEYCKVKSEIKQQLDAGNSFTKETARLNTVKGKMKKNKTPIPTSCPN